MLHSCYTRWYYDFQHFNPQLFLLKIKHETCHIETMFSMIFKGFSKYNILVHSLQAQTLGFKSKIKDIKTNEQNGKLLMIILFTHRWMIFH